MGFDVIPAIDLSGGRVVRLLQGRFDAVTAFPDDPLDLARRFWRDGARSLHVIDLDAARTGEQSETHRAVIARLARERPIGGTLQVGGGYRSVSQIDEAIALGVDRVLVGTLAFRDPAGLAEAVGRHGRRICVTADALAGSVRVAGWLEDSGLDVAAAVADLSARGVEAFLVTAIERDGTLAGHDLAQLRAVRAATGGLLLASGGIGSLEDILATREAGADGVVVGRALLSGAVELREALTATLPA